MGPGVIRGMIGHMSYNSFFIIYFLRFVLPFHLLTIDSQFYEWVAVAAIYNDKKSKRVIFHRITW